MFTKEEIDTFINVRQRLQDYDKWMDKDWKKKFQEATNYWYFPEFEYIGEGSPDHIVSVSKSYEGDLDMVYVPARYLYDPASMDIDIEAKKKAEAERKKKEREEEKERKKKAEDIQYKTYLRLKEKYEGNTTKSIG